MTWQTILFDLDGTLTDSAVGITRAASYALAKFHIDAAPEALYHLVGPPLQACFMNEYGLEENDAMEAIRQFRVYYEDKGWLENSPYPGVFQLLQHLREAGKDLLVVTSKAEHQAVRILEHFGLAPFFDDICGVHIGASELHEKADILRRALHGRSTSGCIMVGDRRYDMEAAHAVGLPAVGVTYGYGSLAELADCGADYILHSVVQLEQFLLE